MTREKKIYSAEFKIQNLREHLENQVPVSKLSEQPNLNPNSFYNWIKELFNGALLTFSKKNQFSKMKSSAIIEIHSC